MLRFSIWKILGILAVLFFGFMLALPNALPNTFMGVAPDQPRSQSAEDLSAFQEARNQAAEAWWPGLFPDKKVKLGLDLQGGVYLLMELDPEEVVANRMEIIQRDVRLALRGAGAADRINARIERSEDQLLVTLRETTEAQEAVRRINRDANAPVQGAIGGQRELDVQSTGNGRLRVTMTAAAREALVQDAQRKTIEIVRRRIDPDGVSEISVQPQGDNRIVLESPGEADPQRIKNILGQAGRMTFNLVSSSQTDLETALAGRVRPGYNLLYDIDTGFPLLVNDTPIVTGSDIATAAQEFDIQRGNAVIVTFRLNAAGARRFGDATAENTGRQFAIVLDDRVMSAPRINEPIFGGNVQITGSFTIEEAQDLAAIIEAGELPAKLQFINERTISPTLGEDSIRAGTTASIIGLILVAFFMIFAYSRLGIYAVLSLMANIMLILGALSGLGATLTLPGIAGIILTIGMAVDANVLVFERIREESRSGRGAMTAVQAGYERALSAILDANITTFIAAVMLYSFGSGPVKGFAVTLAIGILTSVFTAFVVTRWFTSLWLDRARPKKLAI
ncbi:MAG: protein translocase subunit SecD [Pseudomonadota bacterium]